jgi:hypothetical protein
MRKEDVRNVLIPTYTWPLHRFAVLLTWDLDDPLARPILGLSRPGQPTVWREFQVGLTVTDDQALEVFEAVYAALESTEEVTLEAIDEADA